MTGPLADLVAAAVRAPSGDNTQPWRFTIDSGGDSFTIHTDPARDPSPMNAGGRMSRVAVGAAVENLVWMAARLGWTAQAVPMSDATGVAVELRPTEHVEHPLHAAIRPRVTNRRLYDGCPIEPERLGRIERLVSPHDGIEVDFVVDRGRLAGLAELIAAADATMFGRPPMRAAFLHNIRFDAPAAAEVDEGLSLGSLELKPPDRIALKLMPRLPDALFRLMGGARTFAKHTRKLVNSASGLCVVTAADRSAATDFAVGRVFQRVWLALTAEGLAAQPMMSIPVLDSAVEHDDPSVRDEAVRRRIGDLVSKLLDQLHRKSPRRPAAILRFGIAPPPSGRTGRRPVDVVLR